VFTLALALLAGALLVSVCSYTQVTPIVTRPPRRPEGCAVDLFPTTPPPYVYTAIAKARTECDPVRRHTCVEQLRSEACRAGADAIVGFKESMGEVTMFIDTTFVVKGLPAPDTSGSEGACDPICSPGFVCQGGHCIPQCNPPCQAGEICNRKRVCEPAKENPPGPATDQPDAASGVPTAVPKE
jgi:hypothetical protein